MTQPHESITTAGYDGFKAGVITGALITAEAGLSTAMTQAIGLLGLDHPLTKRIGDAQDALDKARKINSTVNQDAMVGRL